MPAPKKSSTPKWIRPVVTVVLAIVVIVIIKYVWNRSNQISEYNRIIEDDINQGKYEEAIPRLETLMNTAQSSVATQAKTELAKCYIQLGDKPELSLKQRAEQFKKANDLDPTTLNDSQKSEMKLGLAPPAPEEEKQ